MFLSFTLADTLHTLHHSWSASVHEEHLIKPGQFRCVCLYVRALKCTHIRACQLMHPLHCPLSPHMVGFLPHTALNIETAMTVARTVMA